MLGEAAEPGRLRDAGRGLLLGLAAGEAAAAPPDGRLPQTHMALAVAESLRVKGRPEASHLLTSWLRLPPEDWPPPESVSGAALALAGRGLPARELARAAARAASGGLQDPPLCRCLPVALAAHRSGGATRAWAQLVAGITHEDRQVQLAAVAGAMLARDLLTRDLADALSRVTQAVREDTPEGLIRQLRAGEPGEALPEGGDSASVLAAAVQALGRARSWSEAVADAGSRGGGGDPLPALVGALAGARWGASGLPEAELSAVPAPLRGELASAASNLLDRGLPGAALPAWVAELRG